MFNLDFEILRVEDMPIVIEKVHYCINKILHDCLSVIESKPRAEETWFSFEVPSSGPVWQVSVKELDHSIVLVKKNG